MTPNPPRILEHLIKLACGQKVEPFPLLPGVALSTQTLTLSLASLSSVPVEEALRALPQPGRPQALLPPLPPAVLPSHGVATLLTREGWDQTRLSCLPPAVAVPLLAALAECQQAPPLNWPDAALKLVERDDLGAPLEWVGDAAEDVGESEDGLSSLVSPLSRLRWPNDQRVSEARRLLQSTKPVTVSVLQRPEVSDHDFMEEQEQCTGGPGCQPLARWQHPRGRH